METAGFRQEYWVRIRLRVKSYLKYGTEACSVLFASLSPGTRKYLAHNTRLHYNIKNLFDLKISFMIQEALLLDPALSVETSQSKICQSVSYPDIQVPSNY